MGLSGTSRPSCRATLIGSGDSLAGVTYEAYEEVPTVQTGVTTCLSDSSVIVSVSVG